jgi:hypothetical protein
MTATTTETLIPQITKTRNAMAKAQTQRSYVEVEEMLRDMALVLRLTRKLSAQVKAEEHARLATAPGLPLPTICE